MFKVTSQAGMVSQNPEQDGPFNELVLGEWHKDIANGLAMFKSEKAGVRFKGILKDDL